MYHQEMAEMVMNSQSGACADMLERAVPTSSMSTMTGVLLACGVLLVGHSYLRTMAPRDADEVPCTSLYDKCTFLQAPKGGWISVYDCMGRAARCAFAFYYLLSSKRLGELYRFLVAYHELWHFGKQRPWLLACTLPLWPALMLFYSVWQCLKKCLRPKKPQVNVFFTQPSNIVSRVAFDFVMEASVPLTIFMVHGSNIDALQGSHHDYICTKPFWRKHLEGAGLRVPLCLGTWTGGECFWESRASGQGDDYIMGDLVLKLPDGCLGRGDIFLEAGTDHYDGSLGATRRALQENFEGIDGVLVLEWVRPAGWCEVHSFDICTMACADGTVELVSCLYWGGCNGSSTHDATVGFVCDVQSETFLAPTSWYSACFATSSRVPGVENQRTPRVGSSFPGMKEMCLAAVRAHGAVLAEQPWLRMVGWDAMFTDKDPVFFEGNYASHRIPRRAFLTWQLTMEFLERSQQYSKIPMAGERYSALAAVVSPIHSLHGKPPLPLAVPESVGLSSERLVQISNWSDGWCSSLKVPGLITAVARHGKLCFVHSSGWADVERRTLLDTRTVMRIYSMTKPVVSVAVMRLYEQGLFQLDEPISRYLASFARPKVLKENGEVETASREITFIDLLTHTSGIGYNDDEEDSLMNIAYGHAGAQDPDSVTLAEFVDRLGSVPLHFEPGSSWKYGYSTDVLGRLLEILTSLPLDEVLEREVFAPLRMTDTGFAVAKDKEYRLAGIYVVEDEDERTKEAKAESQRFERFDNCVSIMRVSADSAVKSENSFQPKITTALLSLASTANTKSNEHCHLGILAGKTVLEHVLNQLFASAIRRIVLVVAGQTQACELVAATSLVSDGQLQVDFVDVGEDYTGGWTQSLLHAESAIGTSNFLLCTADHIHDASLISRLVASSLATSRDRRGFDAIALVEEVSSSDSLAREAVRACFRQQADGSKRISAIGNADRCLRADAVEAGMYACSSRVFGALRQMGDGYFQLAQLMNVLAQKERLGCVTTDGAIWFRCKIGQAVTCCQRPKHGSSLVKHRPSWEVSLPSGDEPPVFSIPKEAIAVAKSATCFKVADDGYCGSYRSRPLNLSGGAGLVSTMHDYCLFCQMLLNGGDLHGVRVLSRKTVEYMRNNFLPLNHTGRRQDIATIATDSGFSETTFDGIGFGIGWSVMMDPVKAATLTSKYEHGWGGWASTFFSIDPTEDMFVVSMAQLIPSDRYPIRKQLRCLISQSLIA